MDKRSIYCSDIIIQLFSLWGGIAKEPAKLISADKKIKHDFGLQNKKILVKMDSRIYYFMERVPYDTCCWALIALWYKAFTWINVDLVHNGS